MDLLKPVYFILFFLNYSIIGFAQQRVVADLHFNANNHSINLLSDSDIDNGDVFNESINGNLQGAIVLNRLLANKDGYAEYTIDKFDNGPTIDVRLLLFDEDVNGSEKFIIKLNNGNVDIFFNGSFTNVDTYSNGDVFKIERCLDKVLYYKNGVEYTAYQSPASPSIVLIAKAEIVGADVNGSGEFPRLVMTFPNDLTNNNYVQLKKKMDGSFVKSNRNKLKFTYIEKYAQESGDQIFCTIYDWKGDIQGGQQSYPNLYGVNWMILPIPNGLIPDDFYTLEVSGPNKGETYYLRFKY